MYLLLLLVLLLPLPHAVVFFLLPLLLKGTPKKHRSARSSSLCDSKCDAFSSSWRSTPTTFFFYFCFFLFLFLFLFSFLYFHPFLYLGAPQHLSNGCLFFFFFFFYSFLLYLLQLIKELLFLR
jgi:hypothetical protein